MRTLLRYIFLIVCLLLPILYFRYSGFPNGKFITLDSLRLKKHTSMEYEVKHSKCEVVHVGIVCTNYKFSLELLIMLKSLYFYRSTPIHFHILVDETSKKVLNTLFETWTVSQVDISFYDINNDRLETHGLLKIMFYNVLAQNFISKIIIINTDLIFTDDIVQLWNLFYDFHETQVLGLVKQPGAGGRFDTGVILYHLEHLKPLEWSGIINKTIAQFEKTNLTDEYVLNSIVRENLDLLYSLPCQWIIQLDNNTDNSRCYNNFKSKIIHWNSSHNFNISSDDAEYFRALQDMHLEYDGNMFRHQLNNCINTSEIPNESLSMDECFEFSELQTHRWRTLLFFREFNYSSTKHDITLVSQLSYDRLERLQEVAELWSGPISITIYISDSELRPSINLIENSNVLQNRFNIAYHAVFKEGYHYPINKLRNVALQNVITPYVFLADIDFLPMPGLYNNLKQYVKTTKRMQKKVLVVPAFETTEYFPQTKQELLYMFYAKDILPFHYSRFRVGHAATNYAKWKSAQVPYKIKWELHYEPYVVVHRSITEYDTRFFGFGWDKSSHTLEMEAQGYEFIVLPDVFIVHKPHPPSFDLNEFRNSKMYKKCLQKRKAEFVKKIKEKYGRKFKV